MKTKLFIAGMLLVATLPVRAASNDLTSALQKGLFEEEANHNLDAAAQAYQSVSAQFDKDRKLAATAIFRLGEVYRKQGKTNEATAQYERIVREFSDQQTLTTLSRQNLAGLGEKKETPGSTLTSRATRLKQRQLLEEEIKLVEKDVAELRKLLETGLVPETDVRAKEREVLKLRQQVAALNVDADDVAAGASAGTPVTDDEEKEIRRIQEMIKNSPDLINAPRGEEGTPLFQAATKGQLQVAAFLLDHGAAVNAPAGSRGKIWNSWTPLIGAANGGHKAVVELLLARSADANAGDEQGTSALHKAAGRGFKGVIEVLLMHQTDVNATNGNGATPLHMAVMESPKAVVELLLAKGANVNASIPADFNSNTRLGFISGTPLHLAARRGDPEIVALLLDNRADINAQAQGMMSKGRMPLQSAVSQGSSEIVELLLKRGANPNAGKLDLPFALAVQAKDLKLGEILLRAGADPNLASKTSQFVGAPGQPYAQNTIGNGPFGPYTPFQIAVAQGDTAMVKLLLKFKADAKAKDPWSSSPKPLVFHAVGNVEMLKALLDAGADPDARDSSYGNPLLNAAAWQGADQTELLLAHHANVNVHDEGDTTPLHVAAQKGDEKTTRLLLDAGAEMNRRNRESPGLTPLWKALLGRKTDVVGLLLAHGADPNLTVDNGTTPLHWAVNQEDRPLVQLLLTNKANVNVRDKTGKTPLDFAKEKLARSGSPVPNVGAPPQSPGTLADLLRQHGAVDDLPRVDRMEIRRTSANFSAIVFAKGTNDWNQFSLLELISCHYGLVSDQRSGHPQPRTTKIPAIWLGNALRFPDFKKLVIHRPAADGRSWTTIPVNVADMLSSGDCSGDVTLRWGDVVEIPEADHPVTENWPGLSDPDVATLIKCVSRTITVAINRTNAVLKLSPELVRNYSQPLQLRDERWLQPGDAILYTATFMLRSVLDHSKLIRFSSDLTRVKVAHHDPATGQTRDWLLDCNDPGQAPDLWLRDGDVIEVPDKP